MTEKKALPGPGDVLKKLFHQWFRRPSGDGLEKTIGYRFQNPDLLAQALIHRSWIAGKDMAYWQTNERLEFLGDSVLNMLTTEYLYGSFPEMPEGDLSKKKSAIVSGRALAESARAWDLGTFLRIGKGEVKAGGRERESILADAFEAVIGAVYLDGGIEPCRKLLQKAHFPRTASILSDTLFYNYKSLLLEKLQATLQTTPDYRLVDESGPEHAKSFRIEVRIQGRVRGVGEGASKKKAEQEAARLALESMDSDINVEVLKENLA